MGITGNLETMNLAELLQWLANGRQTGTLIINNASVEKKIFIRDGAILSSSSSDPRGFLGHFLVSKGVITEDDLARAMEIQAEQGKLLGEILVEGGAIEQELLDHMLRLKAEENICDLFAWEGGDFEFHDGELPSYDLVPMSANVTGLIMEGMRRIDHSRAVKEVIPSPLCVPVAVASLQDDDELDYGWKGVLEAVDDDRSIEDICLHTHSSEFFVCEVLWPKIREGKIKVVRPRVVAAEVEAPVAATPETTPGKSPTNAQALISEAMMHLKIGVYEPAARHLRAATSLDPHNRELAMVIKELEVEVLAGLEKDGVKDGAVPVLETTLDDLRAMSFSPEEGFILSRINGTSNIASIVKISPLSELDSLLVFWKLARSGQIKLVEPK